MAAVAVSDGVPSYVEPPTLRLGLAAVVDSTTESKHHALSCLLASLGDRGGEWTVEIADDKAVLATATGLKTFDISDISNPVELSSYREDLFLSDVSLDWPRAVFTETQYNTVQIVDLSTPSTPSSLGEIQQSERPFHCVTNGDSLFVSCEWKNGYTPTLKIYDIL